MGFVIARSKTTGREQEIPEEWLDHPVLGKDFELVTVTQAGEVQLPTGEPTKEWTVKQLTKYAADQGIDLGGAKAKADVLAVINKSPANGEEE